MSSRVVLGVGAGIAAYKSCELLRLLTESGHQVRVVPTPDALRFVGEATWAALSGQPVTTDAWTGVSEVPHVRIGQAADLVLVAPATADLLARAAAGMAGDLLTATLLTARCPVLYAPAMHTEMWEHPATQANVALLRRRGAIVLEPATGRLTGRDSGPGRLPEPAGIFAVATRLLARGPVTADLAGRRVVVSAGGTREEIDPVRFIGNWSTGTQGYALASTAAARGAEVIVVAANVALPDPAGAKVTRVVSAREMRDAVLAAAAGADAVVMAAAVADYRPRHPSEHKVKKSARPAALELEPNPDILRRLATRKGRRVLIGFAAETEHVVREARRKLAEKRLDLIVGNDVTAPGAAFGGDTNVVHLIDAAGEEQALPLLSKEEVADRILDWVVAHRSTATRRPTLRRVR